MKMPIYRPNYNQKILRKFVQKSEENCLKLEKGKLTNSNVVTNPNLP